MFGRAHHQKKEAHHREIKTVIGYGSCSDKGKDPFCVKKRLHLESRRNSPLNNVFIFIYH